MLRKISSNLPPAIFLMGPTASGKTAATITLYEQLPVEIISVDSALVYRGMDIGTAKPDATLQARAPHHLIDLITPLEAYSAARFKQDALALMHEASARNKIPLLVGGTMLYFNVIQHGLSALPEADAEVRARIETEALRVGWPAMHAKLAAIDPEVADKVQPNDMQRIERALEVFHITGQPMSVLRNSTSQQALPFNLIKIGLMPSDRSVLHQRIAERFEAMLSRGLIEEVAALIQQYPQLSDDYPSMRCVGYRQTLQYLQGEIDRKTLGEHGLYATRQLAKRQLTWMRGMEDLLTLDCLHPDWVELMLSRVQQHLQ